MITESGLLEEFNLSSDTFLNRISGAPCQWNRSRGKFTVNARFFLHSSIVTGSTMASILFHFASQAWSSKVGGVPPDIYRLSLLMTLLLGLGVVTHFAISLYLEPARMEELIREMAKVEESHMKDECPTWRKRMLSRPTTRIAVLTCKTIRLSNKLLPPAFAGIAVISPTWALNIAEYYPLKLTLLPGDLIAMEVPFLGWIVNAVVTFGWNLIVMAFGVSCWGLIVSVILTMSTWLITANLYFQRCIHRANSNWLGIHRQIQLISELVNKSISSTLVLLLVDLVYGEILAAFYLCRGHDSMIKMFFAVILMDSVIGVCFLYGFCGEVHHISKIGNEKRVRGHEILEEGRMKRKLYRRMARSLPVIKVKFGNDNYLEKLTPSVFQQFATERIVDCLLLTK